MPRIIETKEETKTIVKEVSVEITCDFCGKRTEDTSSTGCSIKWKEWNELYEENQNTYIHCSLSTSDEDIAIIICPDCFRKLNDTKNLTFNYGNVIEELRKAKETIIKFQTNNDVIIASMRDKVNEAFSDLHIFTNRLSKIKYSIEELEKKITNP